MNLAILIVTFLKILIMLRYEDINGGIHHYHRLLANAESVSCSTSLTVNKKRFTEYLDNFLSTVKKIKKLKCDLIFPFLGSLTPFKINC